MQCFHFVGDYQIVLGIESVRYQFQRVFIGGRERNQGTFHADTFEKVTKQFQSDESQHHGGNTDSVHSCADCQSNAASGFRSVVRTNVETG